MKTKLKTKQQPSPKTKKKTATKKHMARIWKKTVVKLCDCKRCAKRRTARASIVRSCNKNVVPFLVERLCLKPSDGHVLSDALDRARGVQSSMLPNARAIPALLRSISDTIDFAFSEELRFLAHEREPELPSVTGFFDHTLVPITTQDKTFWSGKHKKYGVKYLVTVSAQGTILAVYGPFSGRDHDFKTVKTPMVRGSALRKHFDGDLLLADLGYLGSHPRHISLPFKKPGSRELTDEEFWSNMSLARYRSRVEHTFANFKGRFKYFANSGAVRDLELHGVLFKLACLAYSYGQSEANRKFPKYATHNAAHGLERPKAENLPPRGEECKCRMFP